MQNPSFLMQNSSFLADLHIPEIAHVADGGIRATVSLIDNPPFSAHNPPCL